MNASVEYSSVPPKGRLCITKSIFIYVNNKKYLLVFCIVEILLENVADLTTQILLCSSTLSYSILTPTLREILKYDYHILNILSFINMVQLYTITCILCRGTNFTLQILYMNV